MACLPQKLLDAKLKRVALEGAAARAAGRNPLADAKEDDDRDDATGADGRREEGGGRPLADPVLALRDCIWKGLDGGAEGRRLAWRRKAIHPLLWPCCGLTPTLPPPCCARCAVLCCAADLEAEQALADAAMAALLEEEET